MGDSLVELRFVRNVIRQSDEYCWRVSFSELVFTANSRWYGWVELMTIGVGRLKGGGSGDT